MKSVNIFSKVFVLATLWTVVFLGLAGYAGGKALEQDPDLIQKVNDKYNVAIHIGGMSKKYGGKDFAETKNAWTFPATTTQINLKSVSANFSFRKSSGTDIVVTATGGLDTSKAPQLLETTHSGTTLTLQEPDVEATRQVHVYIELPASVIANIEIGSVSGDSTFENLQLKDLTVKSVSGDISLNQTSAQVVSLSGVSADLKAENCEFQKLVAKTISGDVDYSATKPAAFDVTTVSGDIKIKLPKSEDFLFNLQSISGKIENALGRPKNGKLEVKVFTTSGDIEIN